MKRGKYKKSQIIGSLLILLGILLIIYNHFDMYEIKKKRINLIKKYENNIKIDNKKDSYIAIIKIPKIDLVEVLVDYSSNLNTVNKNIQTIKFELDYDKGNTILAAHSGNGRHSFFKNLYKLEKDNIIYIYYNNIKYSFKINNIYNVTKGNVEIIRENDKFTLTLITCNQKDKTKQIVIISELIEKSI